MKLRFILLIILGSTFMSAPSLAERYSIISKDAFKAKRLLATLRSHHIKFGVLLSKRSKIEAWEKSLKLSQMTLDKTFKEASEDQQNVKNAKLSQDDFNLKWKATGRIDKTRQILVKFQSEIIHYNKFRLSYNTLANELKGFLHNRSKTEDLTDLMYKMQKLMLALELAFKNQQYDKAVLLVSKSDIAKEFGYKKK